MQRLIAKQNELLNGLSEEEESELKQHLDYWASDYHQRAWQARAEKEGKTIEQVKEDNKKFWRSIIDQSYIGQLRNSTDKTD